jgi:hypothetical protein
VYTRYTPVYTRTYWYILTYTTLNFESGCCRLAEPFCVGCTLVVCIAHSMFFSVVCSTVRPPRRALSRPNYPYSGIYGYILGLYPFIPVWHFPHWYIPVCTSMSEIYDMYGVHTLRTGSTSRTYLDILVCTFFFGNAIVYSRMYYAPRKVI